MKIEANRFTPLLPLIQNYFQSSLNRHTLNQFVSEKQLLLVVIEKGPVLCVTDMKYSVQAAKNKANLENIHPFGTQTTTYYDVENRSWISFNAKVQDLRQPSKYPTAYQPYFYFKDQYDIYRKQRATVILKLQCEVIKVKKWSFRVVNVSKSGYYGLVLQLIDFRFTGQRALQNVKDITSVLYEPLPRTKLQIVRLNDLKRLYAQVGDKKHSWSLFYHCRNMNMNPNTKKRQINLSVLDKDKQILNYDSQRKKHFVNFGVMNEIICLQVPLNHKEIDYARIKKINISNMQQFFNNVTEKQMIAHRAARKQVGIWSSEQQEPDQKEEQKQDVSQPIEIEDSQQKDDSEESDEDPLKNLYIKQFKNLRII